MNSQPGPEGPQTPVPADAAARWRRFQAFVFLGAFLSFLLEPLVGRLLLPAAGGGFLVWATTLVFFQGALLVGYAYGHLAGERIGRGHALALLLGLGFLPIGRGLLGLAPGEAPARDLTWALVVSVGLPFAVLTSTAILAQRWLAASDLPQARDPYPLYALSNAGSLGALAAYPLLVEPLWGLAWQRWLWSAGYLGYLALGLSLLPRGAGAAPAGSEEALPPGRRELLAWVAASALPSAFLMAVSQRVSVLLGSLPLVWILPLAVYLITFMLTFAERPRLAGLRRRWALILALAALHWVLDTGDAPLSSLLVQLLALLTLGLAAHGALYEARPPARYLGSYYVAIALGGWLGGAAVAFLAPLIPGLEGLEEYPLCLLALPLVLLALQPGRLAGAWREERRALLRSAALPLALLGAALGVYGYRESLRGSLLFRNYYGVYRVADLQEEHGGEPRVLRYLIHGTTNHGVEARTTPDELGRPAGYYHPAAGVGQAFRARPAGDVAVVGLGAGGLAGYARAGERWVFYELDPLVGDIARGHFTFLPRLEEARARDPRAPEVELVYGDARLRLTEAAPHRFALIGVDAFSGGSIPTHLLTREALELYRSKLAPGGWITLHLSSDSYDLSSVAVATARALDPPLAALVHRSRPPREPYEFNTIVVTLAERPEHLAPLAQGPDWVTPEVAEVVPLTPWSDDYTNLLAPLWARATR